MAVAHLVRAPLCGSGGGGFDPRQPPQMAWVYILQSEKSGRHYIGSTDNLKRRLNEHNRGKNISTRNKEPWLIIYSDEYESLLEARKREMEIKRYKGGKAYLIVGILQRKCLMYQDVK